MKTMDTETAERIDETGRRADTVFQESAPCAADTGSPTDPAGAAASGDAGNAAAEDPACPDPADEPETDGVCSCGKRKKRRTEEEVRKLMNRLKRIEGQIRGIESMLENYAYCPDIMIQVSAVNCALNSFNKELLAQHLRSCVVDDIRAGKDESIDELVRVLQKVMK